METEAAQTQQPADESVLSASDLTVLSLALSTAERSVPPELVGDVRQIGSLIEHARQIWLTEMERQHAAQAVGADTDQFSERQDVVTLLRRVNSQLRQFSVRYSGFGFATVNCPHPVDKFVVGESVQDLRRAQPLVSDLLRKLGTVETAA